MANVIPVVYCFDAEYAIYAAVSTYSLIVNADSSLIVYWVVCKRDAISTELLAKKFNIYGFCIHVVVVDDILFTGHKQHSYISTATYLKLVIPYVIKEEKVVYIDCDTLVLADIAELYNHEMYENAIGGVIDLWGGWGSKIPLRKHDPFVNTGVMLMNLNLLRIDKFSEQCEYIYKKYRDFIVGMDQCILNKYAEGKKLLLDKKWNRQILSNHEVWLELENKTLTNSDHIIVHFLGPVKPWQDWCDPLISNFWWSYANKLDIIYIKSKRIINMQQAASLIWWIRQNKSYNKLAYLKLNTIVDLLFFTCLRMCNKIVRKISSFIKIGR